MRLALFDLDNTLLAGDSDHSWGEWLCQRGLVDAGEYQARNDAFYADYLAGTLDCIGHTRFEGADAVAADPTAGEAGLADRTAPRDATESAIHALWVEVLGHRAFGVLDDFFELGGNSLRMTQVFSRLRDRFGVDPAVGDLGRHHEQQQRQHDQEYPRSVALMPGVGRGEPDQQRPGERADADERHGDDRGQGARTEDERAHAAPTVRSTSSTVR